jgi:glycosyltransferase involved in cell wall biosynthesis
MVSIIIPTASRPQMLRTALESVANQTATDQIERVFVSENGGDRRSEAVCAEFPTLPITYIFRASTTKATPLQHIQILMRECLQGELTAFLHDDDWWTPSHLANAIKNMESNPDAGAYGSSHFVVSGESSMLNCSGNLFPWFGSGYPEFKPVWELSRLNVLMAELLGTVAHYSSMVARTEILRKAAYVYDLNNPFDNDRMLIFALSAFGSFLYNPVPEVFVRNHGVQDCFSFDGQTRINHMCETTRWMVQSSGKSWDQIASNFEKKMALCPESARPTLRLLAGKEWCLPELNRNRNLKPVIPSPRPEVVTVGA